MVAFLVITLCGFVFVGVVCILLYLWIQQDSYEFDMRHVWVQQQATLEQMEFKRR